MSGFATFSDLTTALTFANKIQRISFSKTNSSQTARIPHTTWLAAGMPTAGATPTAGLAGAVKCSKSSAGAVMFNNPVSGQTTHLMGWGMSRSGTSTGLGVFGCTYYLVDRLAHANVAINQANGSFSPVIDGTDRLAAGEGAQIICEVTSALSAASNSFTLTYTDQDGNSSSTSSVATIASQGADKFAYSNGAATIPIFVPLASGDSGARTITDWTLDSGTATGNMTIALVRVLAILPSPSTFSYSESDYAIQLQNMVKIPDNACLQMFMIPGTAATVDHQGEILLVQS